MGLPLSVLHHGRLPSRPWREDSPTTHRIRNKKKREGKKNDRGIFRSLVLCPSRTAESHSQIVVSTLLFRNLIARGAGSLRPSYGCTCFGLDQFLASASSVSHFSVRGGSGGAGEIVNWRTSLPSDGGRGREVRLLKRLLYPFCAI